MVIAILPSCFGTFDHFAFMMFADDDDDDAESDSGDSEDSCDSDATIEEKDITFINVATRPSAIETPLHPSVLLADRLMWHTKNINGTYDRQCDSPLIKAVIDDDLEAFVNILSFYRSSPLPIVVPATLLDRIFQYDRPEMLDEYLRRTGDGIVIKTGHEDTVANDQNKLYLGLSVHGKKRADLAKRNDPNARHDGTTYPMVWRAGLKGSTAIVDYLASDRPLTAYKYYASTNGDGAALAIRRVPNLEKVLPLWLGWNLTDQGDSPLMAAVLGGKVDALKKLFTKEPKLLGSCLHQRFGHSYFCVSQSHPCLKYQIHGV